MIGLSDKLQLRFRAVRNKNMMQIGDTTPHTWVSLCQYYLL